MNNLIVIENIAVVNSAESYVGDMMINNKRAAMPFFNLSVNRGHVHHLLQTESSKYLNFAYLIFEDVIELSYEKRNTCRDQDDDRITECYGGTSIYDNDYFLEFWITYGRGKLVLNQEHFAFSERPFVFSKNDFDSYPLNIHDLF